ncbi:DNA cytosine methyltransferase [Streptomyces sp. NPDC014870]|uniref:DNA cytosine methyltransferase n=1 Tax=Streptomyces sp. NPDC014870 TaxID=3364925 RepID=UPI0036F5D6F7
MTGGLRIGSLCTGYGGLDMAVQTVLGGSLAWVSDLDPGATRILAHHHPRVPNLGDLTTADWSRVEPVDIVCGGYPCQPFSTAGKRKGTADERHIWPSIANALRVLRPRYAVFENVAGHVRLGFADVLADLARLGFDAQWCLVRASEIDAPHQRQRLFLLATAQDTHREPGHQRRLTAPRQAEDRGARTDAGGRGGAPVAHADGHALRDQPVTEPGRGGTPVAELAGPKAPADTDRNRREEQQRRESGLGAWRNPDGRGAECWRRFAPAIARWEAVLGRRAPWATDDRGRLNPEFVEWLMGLPAGHVTDVPDLTRAQQLKALGNGVVPQQAEAALRVLLDRAEPVDTPMAA